MAAILSESFNYADTEAMGRRWDITTNPTYGEVTIVDGRFEKAVKLRSRNVYAEETAGATLAFTSPSTTIFWGFAFKYAGLHTTTNAIDDTPIITFFNGTKVQGAIFLGYFINRLIVKSAASFDTEVYVSNTVLDADTWYWIEIKATFGNAGSITVRVNGVTDININNVSIDLQHSATLVAGCDAFSFHRFYGITGFTDATMTFCDLVLYDDSGSINNDFLGDCKVLIRRPDGIGTHTDWSPTGAANNWDCVNDTVADDDATYVSTETGGAKDYYTFEDVASSPTIHFVQQVVHARKDDAGARSIKLGCISGATESVGSEIPMTVDYMVGTRVYETDPDTSAQWTVSGYNDAEFGQEATS